MTTTRAKQTAFDISLQEVGNIEAAFEVAARLLTSVTAEIPPASVLPAPLVSPATSDIADYYHRHNIHPATAD